jgi:hypothetical protein
VPISNSDAILWYNVGEFGDAGYAVPNWSDDIKSLNPGIHALTELIGRNLFTIMHHEDVDLRTPPSINTLKRIHRLYVRASQVIAARSVAPGTDNMETLHVTPSEETFLVFPVPFFKVRNPQLKTWCRLALTLLSECFQHTENRREVEISTAFGGLVGQYLTRIYTMMATEMFGKTSAEVSASGFLLKDADFAAYDPSKWFTSTEMSDTVPNFTRVFTEDRRAVLAEGIPVTQLPALTTWPGNSSPSATGQPSASAVQTTAIFPPPPGP